MKGLKILEALVLVLMFFSYVNCIKKYSEELNVMSELQTNDKPFRMQKLNLVWDKARKRLSAEKLKLLNSELKRQDKDEITLKRVKAEGADKDGMKEAELRKTLHGILKRYDLTDHIESPIIKDSQKPSQNIFNEAFDKEAQNRIYKDKKLNKLWMKAERVGFSEEELKTLKEEFLHHQEKLEEYYELVNSMPSENDMDNSVDSIKSSTSKDYASLKQTLKEKHRDLKTNIERLGKLAALGPENKEFDEPKVKALWDVILKSNFSEADLDSLKEELRHFEHRIKKLEYFKSQIDVAEAGNKWNDENFEERQRLEEKVKKYSQKVDKIHEELEGRLLQRHLEL